MSTQATLSISTANLDIPDDLKACAQSFAPRTGVHEGTVLLIMIAILSSLRSRGVTIEWMDRIHRPFLGILYLEGQVYPLRGWLDRLLAVAEKCSDDGFPKVLSKSESPLPHFKALLKSLGSQKLIAQAKVDPVTHDDLIRHRMEAGRMIDAWIAKRLSKSLPDEFQFNFGFNFSPLIVSEDKHVVDSANVTDRARFWEDIFNGLDLPTLGRTVPPTLILRASRQMVRRLWTLRHSESFNWPLLLPATGGKISAPILGEEELMAKWTDLVMDASASWENDPRTLHIGDKGHAELSGVRDYMDRAVVSGVFPERMGWAVGSCVSLAAWHHLTTNGAEDTISPESWRSAGKLVRYAMDAHAVATRRCGGARMVNHD